MAENSTVRLYSLNHDRILEFTLRVLAPSPPVPVNPCVPSPCGPFSQCQDIGGIPSCSCLPNYVGSAPNCRPECSINSDCTSDKACIREKCRDPCPGSCGTNAYCNVINHTPVCTCPTDYTGDPFTSCRLTPTRKDYCWLFHVQWLTKVSVHYECSNIFTSNVVFSKMKVAADFRVMNN